MLTHTLRGLERDGLVVRTVFPPVPPRVEYALSTLTVLLISSVPESIAGLERIFRNRNWRLEKVRTWREAITFVRSAGARVIICEQDL
jgi:hypothetical protein